MKNMLKKITAIVVTCVLFLTFCKMPVIAAGTANVSISAPANVTEGTQFSVTVNVSGDSVYGVAIDIGYSKDIIQLVPNGTNVFGGEGLAKIFSDSTTTSFTLTFNALSSGTASIKMNTTDYTIGSMGQNSELKLATGSTPQASVTVSPPSNVSYSSNNNLSLLTVTTDQGANVALSPSFSSDVTKYNATVPYDCTKLILGAPAEDVNAKDVKISGTKMDPGANTTTITVTAQNGAVKKYIIYTTREAAPANNNNNNQTVTKPADQTQAETQAPTEAATIAPVLSVKVDGNDYTISDNFGGNELPQGYISEQIDYNGQKISAAKGVNGLTIVYLEKADGSGGSFYVYDVKTKTFSLLSTVSQPTLLYTILPITKNMEIPEGYKASTLDIAGRTVDVLIPNGTNVKFCLFYGVDEKGTAGWYRYDYAEKTVQKYYGGGAEMATTAAKADTTQTAGDNKWIIIAAASGVTAVILLIIALVLAKKLKSKKFVNIGDNYDDDDENTISIEHDDAESYSEGDAIKKNSGTGSDRNVINESINNAAMYIAAMETANIKQAEELEKATNEDSVATFMSDIIADIDAGENITQKVNSLGYDADNESEISELTDILDDDEKEDDYDDDFEFLDVDDFSDESTDEPEISGVEPEVLDLSDADVEADAEAEAELADAEPVDIVPSDAEPEVLEMKDADVTTETTVDLENEVQEEIKEIELEELEINDVVTEVPEFETTEPVAPEPETPELEELEIIDFEELLKEPESNDYEIGISASDDFDNDSDIIFDIDNGPEFNQNNDADNDSDTNSDINIEDDSELNKIDDENDSEKGDWIY